MRAYHLVGVLGLLVVLAAAAAAAESSGLLDGKTFAGETGENGKETGDPESFVFAGGRFDPIQCHPYGFAAAPYTAKKVGEGVQFESTTKSEKEGEMVWTGRVRGDRLEGTMVWRKAGQAPIDYWFRGSLKGE